MSAVVLSKGRLLRSQWILPLLSSSVTPTSTSSSPIFTPTRPSSTTATQARPSAPISITIPPEYLKKYPGIDTRIDLVLRLYELFKDSFKSHTVYTNRPGKIARRIFAKKDVIDKRFPERSFSEVFRIVCNMAMTGGFKSAQADPGKWFTKLLKNDLEALKSLEKETQASHKLLIEGLSANQNELRMASQSVQKELKIAAQNDTLQVAEESGSKKELKTTSQSATPQAVEESGSKEESIEEKEVLEDENEESGSNTVVVDEAIAAFVGKKSVLGMGIAKAIRQLEDDTASTTEEPTVAQVEAVEKTMATFVEEKDGSETTDHNPAARIALSKSLLASGRSPDLLPVFFSNKTQNSLYMEATYLLEECCYNVLAKHVPDIVQQDKFDSPEASELKEWLICIKDLMHTFPSHAFQNRQDLPTAVTAATVVRNSAAHRDRTDAATMMKYLEASSMLPRILKEEVTEKKFRVLLEVAKEMAQKIGQLRIPISRKIYTKLELIDIKQKQIARIQKEIFQYDNEIGSFLLEEKSMRLSAVAGTDRFDLHRRMLKAEQSMERAAAEAAARIAEAKAKREAEREAALEKAKKDKAEADALAKEKVEKEALAAHHEALAAIAANTKARIEQEAENSFTEGLLATAKAPKPSKKSKSSKVDIDIIDGKLVNFGASELNKLQDAHEVGATEEDVKTLNTNKQDEEDQKVEKEKEEEGFKELILESNSTSSKDAESQFEGSNLARGRKIEEPPVKWYNPFSWWR